MPNQLSTAAIHAPMATDCPSPQRISGTHAAHKGKPTCWSSGNSSWEQCIDVNGDSQRCRRSSGSCCCRHSIIFVAGSATCAAFTSPLCFLTRYDDVTACVLHHHHARHHWLQA